MNSANFFIKQLDATRELIEHCLNIMPEDRLRIVPPHFNHPNAGGQECLRDSLGEWPALKVLVHLVLYEEQAVVDEMKRFIYNKEVTIDWKKLELEEKKNSDSFPDKLELIQRFKNVRDKQIKLLEQVDDYLMNEVEKVTSWGKKKLNFVVNKTIQHTITHGSKLYQKALFWDTIWNSLEQEC